MRVQLICAAFPPFGKGGGPATSALIARGLVAAGHEVEVVTASDAPLDERRDGYRVHSIGSPNLYADYWTRHPAWQRVVWHMLENFNPRAYRRVRRAIRAFRPDVLATVSIENVNVASWAAARAEGLRPVHFLHSHFLLCWRGSMFRGGARCAGRCGSCRALSAGKTRLSRLVGTVVGESRAVIDTHRAHGLFAGADSVVLPTPARPVGTPAQGATRPRGGPLTIGYIGTISGEKGVETLARAARMLALRHPGAVRFLVAGSGDAAIETRLRAIFPADATRFLGWADPDAFYAEVDVVVVPSEWDEPYGRVSVEPLGHGVPVVAARSGGLVENVDDGVSGLTFAPGDADDLAAVLDRLVAEPGWVAALSRGAAARAPLYGFDPFVAKLDALVRAASGSSV